MLYTIDNLMKSRQRDAGYTLKISNLQIPYGAKLALVGPSGCGKSTALDILGFSLEPESAENFLFSPNPDLPAVDIMGLWRQNHLEQLTQIRLLHLGYVLQTGELFPYLTNGENICLSGYIGPYEKKMIRESGQRLADLLGILPLWNDYPTTLSIGERQRVAIARALAARPQIILADEPTAALDPLHAKKVMDAFIHCVEDYGSALILATHDINWAKTGGFKELPFHLHKTNNGVTAVLDSN